MGYSRAPGYWRDDDVSLSSDDELVSSIASSFIRQVKNATVQGLLQGYRTVHEAEPLIRGRLDVAAQIGRRAGLPLPAEVSYDEYTVDVAENRLLLSAARALLTVPRLAESDRQSLRKLLLKFDGVATIARRSAPPDIRFTRLNAHYRPAVVLAQIILRHGSLEQSSGEVTAKSFLFDMWEVFEDFVSVALREAMGSSDGRIDLQYTGKHLDVGAKVSLRPDIVWHKDNVVLAVLDAKYKAEKNKRFRMRTYVSNARLLHQVQNESWASCLRQSRKCRALFAPNRRYRHPHLQPRLGPEKSKSGTAAAAGPESGHKGNRTFENRSPSGNLG